MTDLEKEFERMASEDDMPIHKYLCDDGTENQYEDRSTSIAYDFYSKGWKKRAELAQAEITELKQQIEGLKDLNIELQYSKQRVRVELSDLDAEFILIKQKLEKLESGEWISVEHQLPEQDQFVLVHTASKYANIIVAKFIPKFTNSDGADDQFGEYCEEKDDWFLPEGWYSNVSPVTDEYLSFFLDEEVTHWQPLPKPPKPTNFIDGFIASGGFDRVMGCKNGE